MEGAPHGIGGSKNASGPRSTTGAGGIRSEAIWEPIRITKVAFGDERVHGLDLHHREHLFPGDKVARRLGAFVVPEVHAGPLDPKESGRRMGKTFNGNPAVCRSDIPVYVSIKKQSNGRLS